jgi:hypothetical protein
MAATYIPIATQTLSSTAGIVTFANIPQTYKDLVLVQSARVSTTYDITAIRVNSVTSGYSGIYAYTDGSSNASGQGSSEISMRAGYVPGTGSPYVNEWSNEVYTFFDYTNTAYYKTALSRCAFITGAGTGFNVHMKTTTIPTTGAITQITSQTANGGNWAAGSTFTLYGIASS